MINMNKKDFILKYYGDNKRIYEKNNTKILTK